MTRCRCCAFWCLAILLASWGQPVSAENSALTADQIKKTITGNTVLGEWDDQPYAQYFDPDGTTIFKLQDGRRVEGDWYVEDESDLYCSYHWFRGTSCYALYFDDDGLLLWLEEDGDMLLPSRILEGRQLDLEGVKTDGLAPRKSEAGR